MLQMAMEIPQNYTLKGKFISQLRGNITLDRWVSLQIKQGRGSIPPALLLRCKSVRYLWFGRPVSDIILVGI